VTLTIVGIIIVVPFALAAIVGAPYLPILRRDSTALLDLASLKPGQTIIDLGCGDGRFLRAAAQRGYRGIGYEINPLLYLVSLIVTWRYRHLITIRWRDFWSAKLPPSDAIYVFLIERLMPKLHAKLARDITTPTHVISYVFAIPGQPPIKTTRNAYSYRYGA
jgi:hypothetical protein